MKNSELLSVAEVSKIVGVSRQAIYKRMATDLSTYVVIVDNKKWLNSEVLRCFAVNYSTKKVDNSTEVDILRKMIELLEKENEQLRREKQEEHDQLMKLTEQVGTTLQALTQGQLADKLIEGKRLADSSEPSEPEVKKKKHWWQKWEK